MNMVEIVQLSFSHSSLIINIILITAFILNLIFAFIIIFMERRSAGSIWAWLLVLVFLPIVGFILYLLLGRQIQRKHIFKLKKEDRKGLAMFVDEQLNALEKDDFSKGNHQVVKFKEMVHMLLYNNAAFLTTDNSIKIFTDGHAKFDALIEDIQNAKDYIHIQYYIFKSDGLGRRILKALEDRLEDGIEVKMLYDDMGSRTLRKKDLKQFKDKGGHAEAFFPSKLPLINLRMNNRNHRKIVIIDGKIGYVGGFNVGDEYLGKDKKFGYWRDTHLRLEGDSVNALELRFILDWNSQSTRDNIRYEDRYFPDVDSGGEIGVQIASSGPDEDWEQIKYGYLKMIMSAKHSIYIQSPYFIPDQAFIDAIKIAALGGVEVNLMIPCKPDHPFVYWATLKNAASLLDAGVKIYQYNNGFLHSKTLIVDDEIATVGTANMDNRSFTLNFEVNAFIYDEDISLQLKKAFIKDMKVSYELTKELYNQRSTWIKFKEGISQLLSPIL
ncbi:cardiolipin synthase A/B [Staphylococcus hominis]|mgnify:FL=1|nr:cardiolipin synthase 2 [Plantactinospora veratri]